MSQKSFHLRWNNHLQNLQSLFENLYNEQSLVDVTISCSDGQLYAHKLVLSACSPYFEKVFKENPCKHPTLILKGINAREMQIILQYMYVGAVDVGEDELDLLLDTASELHVKGLVQRSDNPSRLSNEQQKTKEKSKLSKDMYSSGDGTSPNPHYNGEDLRWQAELVAKPPPNKRDIDTSKGHDSMEHPMEENSDSDNVEIKIEQEEYQDPDEESTTKEYYQVNESVDESQEDMQIGVDMTETSKTDGDEAVYFCHICIRSFQNKGSYHRHMLSHAGVKPHSCTFCDQSFLRLSHLQRHIRVHTGERPYQCTRCPKQFARSDKLRQHYLVQHMEVPGIRLPKARGRPRKNPNSYGPPMGNLDPLVYPVMSGIGSSLSISPVPVSISPVPVSNSV